MTGAINEADWHRQHCVRKFRTAERSQSVASGEVEADWANPPLSGVAFLVKRNYVHHKETPILPSAHRSIEVSHSAWKACRNGTTQDRSAIIAVLLVLFMSFSLTRLWLGALINSARGNDLWD